MDYRNYINISTNEIRIKHVERTFFPQFSPINSYTYTRPLTPIN